jgi:hypothetical protein
MNQSGKKRFEFEDDAQLTDEDQNDKKQLEFEDDAQITDADQTNPWAREGDAPKRSPMRRKNRAQTGGFEQKHKRDGKRDDKRKNSRLKYDW